MKVVRLKDGRKAYIIARPTKGAQDKFRKELSRTGAGNEDTFINDGGPRRVQKSVHKIERKAVKVWG